MDARRKMRLMVASTVAACLLAAPAAQALVAQTQARHGSSVVMLLRVLTERLDHDGIQQSTLLTLGLRN